MRAGLLSGLFDPIHAGHLSCARQAARLLKLDRVYFVPTALSPHKKRSGAKAYDRYAMAQLALLNNPLFHLSDIEMGSGEISYTIDTIRKFKKRWRGDLYFIIGLDAFADTYNWKSAVSLLKSCNFIVISRPGLDMEKTVAELERKIGNKNKGVSFTRTGRTLRLSGSRYKIHLCDGQKVDVSSTLIRSRLRRGESIKNLVPKQVERYIMKVELYRK